MPRITVAPHTPALAADFNAVADQAVMTFPTAAARTAAIPTPVEGMHTYRTDVNLLEFWNGTAWQAVMPTYVLAQRRTSNIIPVSGSQIVLTMSGWSAAPVVVTTPEMPYNYYWRFGGVTATQINLFVLDAPTGAALPNGFAVIFHWIIVGVPNPGVIPLITG